ncbi:hypothetical protein SAMN05192555_10292 [Franzmannia pantelleriensis]|uniref:Uncharacterized protein n=1 Tax=Franzmannia pantelleriensis TaxID=48727 RepID=A0A1G9GBG8_9GAMM|nr:hypothetical protein SAMN05192555_10292 [Halomonas pantelleriensis]
MSNTRRKQWKIKLPNCLYITHGTIQNEASNATLSSINQHKLSHQCVSEITTAITDDNIARLRKINCFMQKEIIAWPTTYGKRRSSKAPFIMQRPDIIPARKHSRHAVANVSNRKLPILFYHVLTDNFLARKDTITQCHHNHLLMLNLNKHHDKTHMLESS